MISGGLYFHETSHMQSFAKIKPSRKFPNLQYTTWRAVKKGVDQTVDVKAGLHLFVCRFARVKAQLIDTVKPV